jgi:hypothetical protein
MNKIVKMANRIVETFKYNGYEDLTLEDLRHISVETGEEFGLVASLVYSKTYN